MEKKYPNIDLIKTGQNIKQIMQLKGLSVKDVQDYLGLNTPQSIYHWFNGRNLPTTDNLYALSHLFKIPMDKILVGDMNKSVVVYMDRISVGDMDALEFEERKLLRMRAYINSINGLKAG